jgi:hypothetical protein
VTSQARVWEGLRGGKIWHTAHAIPLPLAASAARTLLTHQTPGRVMPSCPRDVPPGPVRSIALLMGAYLAVGGPIRLS